MVMQHEKRRTWGLGFALVSLLSVGACADVDAAELDQGSDELGQLFPRPTTPAAPATKPSTAVESTVDPHFYPSAAGPALDHEDLGAGDKTDVLTMGDSWMQYGPTEGGIEGAFDRIFRPTRASRAPIYRHKGVAGTEMLPGSGLTLVLGTIPSQFDAAVRENRNIKTVIMTGGGNDILISGPPDCPAGGPQCVAKLGRIKDALVTLWEKMAAAGVQDIVYVGYAEGAGPGKAPPEFANAMKTGVGDACVALKSARCHVFETTGVVKGRFADTIHPPKQVNDELAAAILKFMENEGIRR